MSALDNAIASELTVHGIAGSGWPMRWRLVRDLRDAVLRALARPAGLDELHVALDAHVRRALAAGEPLPPEVRAYVEAATSHGATP